MLRCKYGTVHFGRDGLHGQLESARYVEIGFVNAGSGSGSGSDSGSGSGSSSGTAAVVADPVGVHSLAHVFDRRLFHVFFPVKEDAHDEQGLCLFPWPDVLTTRLKELADRSSDHSALISRAGITAPAAATTAAVGNAGDDPQTGENVVAALRPDVLGIESPTASDLFFIDHGMRSTVKDRQCSWVYDKPRRRAGGPRFDRWKNSGGKRALSTWPIGEPPEGAAGGGGADVLERRSGRVQQKDGRLPPLKFTTYVVTRNGAPIGYNIFHVNPTAPLMPKSAAIGSRLLRSSYDIADLAEHGRDQDDGAAGNSLDFPVGGFAGRGMASSALLDHSGKESPGAQKKRKKQEAGPRASKWVGGGPDLKRRAQGSTLAAIAATALAVSCALFAASSFMLSGRTPSHDMDGCPPTVPACAAGYSPSRLCRRGSGGAARAQPAGQSPPPHSSPSPPGDCSDVQMGVYTRCLDDCADCLPRMDTYAAALAGCIVHEGGGRTAIGLMRDYCGEPPVPGVQLPPVCAPCAEGAYSGAFDTQPCWICRTCPDEDSTAPCSAASDTECFRWAADATALPPPPPPPPAGSNLPFAASVQSGPVSYWFGGLLTQQKNVTTRRRSCTSVSEVSGLLWQCDSTTEAAGGCRADSPNNASDVKARRWPGRRAASATWSLHPTSVRNPWTGVVTERPAVATFALFSGYFPNCDLGGLGWAGKLEARVAVQPRDLWTFEARTQTWTHVGGGAEWSLVDALSIADPVTLAHAFKALDHSKSPNGEGPNDERPYDENFWPSGRQFSQTWSKGSVHLMFSGQTVLAPGSDIVKKLLLNDFWLLDLSPGGKTWLLLAANRNQINTIASSGANGETNVDYPSARIQAAT